MSALPGVNGTSSVHCPPPEGPTWAQWTSGIRGTYLVWNSLLAFRAVEGLTSVFSSASQWGSGAGAWIAIGRRAPPPSLPGPIRGGCARA